MPTLKIEGDGAGAVRAFNDLKRAIDGFTDGLQLSAGEAKKLEIAAGRIVKANEGPQEKYNRRMEELAKLVAAGKLSIEQASEAASRYQQQLERAGQSGLAAFGSKLTSQIMGIVGGMTSLNKLTQTVAEGFRQVDAAAKLSVSQSFAALNSAGELQQLADAPEQFQALVAEARSLVERGVVRPGEQSKAFETVFNLQSAGFNRQERESLIIAAQRKQIADVTGVGGKIRGVQDIFGVEDTGDVGETLDKMLAVSKRTLENLTRTAETFPDFASEAVALGIDFETAGAAYVAARKQSSSSSITASRMRALFSSIDKNDLNQGDLPSTLAAIEARVAGGENISDILGNVRAVAGFRALTSATGRQEFATAYADISGAAGTLERSQYLAADPRLRALSARETEEGRYAATTSELYEERQALFDAVLLSRRRAFAEKNAGWLERTAYNINSDWTQVGRDFLGLEDITLREAAAGFRGYEGLDPETLSAIKDYLQRIDRNTKEAADSASQTNANQRGRVATVPE